MGMIYAVNKATLNHRIHEDGAPIAWEEVLVPTDSEGWVEWRRGSGQPLPDKARCDLKTTCDQGFFYDQLAKDARWTRDSTITHYRPLVSYPEQLKEWRGPEDGLPPVGIVVELRRNDDDWIKGLVVGYDGLRVVCRVDYANYKYQSAVGNGMRPIRTNRERWIDDAMRMSDCPDNAPLIRQYFEAVHDAIKNGDLTMPDDDQ